MAKQFQQTSGSKIYEGYEDVGPLTPNQYQSIVSGIPLSKQSASRMPRDTNQGTPLGNLQQTLQTSFGYIQTPAQIEAKRVGEREDIMKLVDAQIQDIEQRVSEQVATEEERRTQRLGEAKGINIRGGLAGSPFAGARKEGVRTEAQGRITGIEERGETQKALARYQVSQAIQQIEDRATQKLTGARAERLQLFEKGKADALENWKTLAQSEFVDFEVIKQTPIYQQIQEQTGLSELELNAYWNTNLPKQEQIDWKPSWRGNNLILTGINPATGELATQTYTAEDLGIPQGIDVEMVTDENTGKMFWYDKDNPQKDENGNLIMKPVISEAGEAISGDKGEDTEFTPQEQRKLEQEGLLNAPRQQQLDYLYGDGDGDDDVKNYTDKNMPPAIRQEIIDVFNDKEGAIELGKELTLTDLIGLFPEVERETLREYMDEFYDYETLTAEEEEGEGLWQGIKSWFQFWK